MGLSSIIEINLITCEYCGMKVEDYTKHLESYKHYICKFCDKDYFLADELYHHFIKEHSEDRMKKPYSCKKCGCTFGQLGHLNRHKNRKNHF